MKHIATRILVFFFICSACSNEKTSQEKLVSDELNSSLDSLGMAILDEGQILGFSLSIDSAGSLLYTGSFGHIDAAKTNPVRRNTRFDIASVSKLVGVNVIMKLIEQGKLELEQSLDQLLPDFPDKELGKKIKLKHLLSHTSGLQDYAAEIDSVFMASGIVPTKADFFAFFQAKDLFFEPGTNYQYCNSGFMMMAFIAEHATKKSWQALIDEFINQASGLDFQLIKYAVDLPQKSPIFDLEKGEFKKVPDWVYVIGDGGLTASTEMLAKFPQAWTKGKLISKAFFEDMISPRQLDDQTHTAYGLGVRRGEFLGEAIIGHTGGWKTTFAIMAYFPERDLTFAGLMNTDGTNASINSIFAEYMRLSLDLAMPDFKNKNIQLDDPTKFTGTYQGYEGEFDRSMDAIHIRLMGEDQLSYCVDANCEPLFYMGNNKFWLESYPYDYIEFQVNGEGEIAAINEYYHGLFQVFRKKVPKPSP